MRTKELNGWWDIYDRKAEKVKATVYGTYIDAQYKYADIPGIEIRKAKDNPVTAGLR